MHIQEVDQETYKKNREIIALANMMEYALTIAQGLDLDLDGDHMGSAYALVKEMKSLVPRGDMATFDTVITGNC